MKDHFLERLKTLIAGTNVLPEHALLLTSQGKQLLAVKVETHDQFETYKSPGCSLCHGIFFAKPLNLIPADIPASTRAF
ncbi:hypothetical protein [Kaarinaea lacus]